MQVGENDMLVTMIVALWHPGILMDLCCDVKAMHTHTALSFTEVTIQNALWLMVPVVQAKISPGVFHSLFIKMSQHPLQPVEFCSITERVGLRHKDESIGLRHGIGKSDHVFFFPFLKKCVCVCDPHCVSTNNESIPLRHKCNKKWIWQAVKVSSVYLYIVHELSRYWSLFVLPSLPAQIKGPPRGIHVLPEWRLYFPWAWLRIVTYVWDKHGARGLLWLETHRAAPSPGGRSFFSLNVL